jgi:hypothetical protein
MSHRALRLACGWARAEPAKEKAGAKCKYPKNLTLVWSGRDIELSQTSGSFDWLVFAGLQKKELAEGASNP